MKQRIAHIAILVPDYDEAIAFYTEVMGFILVEDTPLGKDKRWVLVAPPGAGGTQLLLARAANENQVRSIGNQAGGRVFLFLHTDDFTRDYDRLTRLGVRFIDGPRREDYGMVGVFEDRYGNKWDLIEPLQEGGT